MTQEEKDLLLEDLCSRLPYDVRGFYKTSGIEITNQKLAYDIIGNLHYKNDVEFKPYLFPLSSMTEEQRKEFLEISHLENRSFYNGEEIVIISNEVWVFDLGGDADTEYRSTDIKRIRETVKWLNKNHFDWRGLIPMGLAENATNKNIY